MAISSDRETNPKNSEYSTILTDFHLADVSASL